MQIPDIFVFTVCFTIISLEVRTRNMCIELMFFCVSKLMYFAYGWLRLIKFLEMWVRKQSEGCKFYVEKIATIIINFQLLRSPRQLYPSLKNVVHNKTKFTIVSN
jgi:hypothetical protein